MAKDWDYSALSKLAKANGGPENYLETKKQHSYQNGRKDQGIVDLAMVLGISLLAWGGVKLNGYFKSKKVSKIEAEQVEKELMEGINSAEEISEEAKEQLKGEEENEPNGE